MIFYVYIGSNITRRTQVQGDQELGDEENVQDLRKNIIADW